MMQFSLLLFTYFALCSWAVSTTGEVNCPRGSFIKNGACELCPIGTYSSSENSASCEDCPIGSYNPFRGGQSFWNCLLCPAGTYSDVPAAKNCKPCPPGKYSQGGATKCLKCAPGEGLDSYRNECRKCYLGFYNDGSFKYCQLCPSGTGSNVIDRPTKCVPCPKGTFRDSRYSPAARCDKCPINSYTNVKGTRQCPMCPLGTIAEKGATDCTPCPAGTFRDTVRKVRCLSCPVGLTSKPGSAACKHPIKGCPFDTFEDPRGACKACLPGERFDASTKSCIRCADDEASRGGAVTSCTKCTGNTAPASDISRYERSECRCKLGYTLGNDGSCEACPPGTYGSERPSGALWNNLYRYSSNRKPYCARCDQGSYSAEAGSTSCKICPKDTFARDFASSSCTKCPEGTVSDPKDSFFEADSIQNSRTDCFHLRHNCGLLYVRDGNLCVGGGCTNRNNPSEANGCRGCDSSEYWDTKYGCSNCPSDEINLEYPHFETSCRKCGQNSVLNVSECVCKKDFGMTAGGKCKLCSLGLVESGRKCVKCVQGVTRIDGGKSRTACTLCKANTYLPEGATKCQPCPTGFKKMRDVAGNYLNMCSPINPYDR